MKLVILKTNLLEGLFSVERSIGVNTNLPILKNVLLTADNNKISIITTNLELAVMHIIQGKIIENGKSTIPLSLFNSVIKNLNSERVTLETKDNNLIIITDNYEAVIQGGNEKDFPIIPSISSNKNSLKISSENFIDSIQSVIIATQYSDIRPEISGVFVSYNNDKLVFVGTDSFRLSEKTLAPSLVNSDFDEISFIIPLKTADELLRVFNKSDGEITILIDQNQVLFSTNVKSITSRVVDGRFPEYQPIIPKSVENEININRQELLNAIKLTSSFSGRTNDVTITIGDNKKFLEVSSREGSLGSGLYKVPCKVKGDALSIVFNWKYIYDGLKIYNSDDVVIGINTPDRPVLIKSTTENNILYVVMPIRK
ncbi:MAG: DNA polymerase III subunit beta [Patescibacteria group bacterium]